MSGNNSKSACATCGKQAPEGARFCGHDGTALSAAASLSPAEASAGQRMCPACKRRYPDYAQFCSFDASRLSAPDSSAVASPQKGKAQGAVAAQSIAAPAKAEFKPAPVPQEAAFAPAAPADVLEEKLTPRAAETEVYSDLLGKTIDGKYVIESVVGEGGMAVVYRADHIQMERTVVIKVMQPWLLSNKNSIERFERECKLTAKLNHPNIVQVYDFGRIGTRQPYLIMEYIKGEPLADKLARQGAMPLTTAGNILIQICRGLQEAHNVGIVHRDLKPENILLQEKSDRPDWVKIVDFGISHLAEGSKRLTRTGKMIGTPEYIAPEQLRDRAIDKRTDIYALGIILFELLVGEVPFTGESAEAVLMKHLLEEAPNLSTLRDDIAPGSTIETIVNKALRKDPEERFQTATEMRLELERVVNDILFKRN